MTGLGPDGYAACVEAVTRLLAPAGAAGAPPWLGPALVDALGPGAADVIAADPWRVLAAPRVTPAQADAFARRRLGAAARPGDPRRARGVVVWLLERAAADGHTVVPSAVVVSALEGLGAGDPAAGVAGTVEDGRVVQVDGDPAGLALARVASAEESLAAGLIRLAAAGRLARIARTRQGEAGLVVVDASTLDVALGAALVEALPDEGRLVLLGDPALLPPAGPGRVLGDLAGAGLPLAQPEAPPDTAIARLVDAVRRGALPPLDEVTRGDGTGPRDVVVVPARDGPEAATRVGQLVTDSIPRALGIPPGDVQVVTPVRGGPAGTDALNVALKQRLNPGPGAHAGFDPGDRVVAVAHRPATGLAPGDVGYVAGAGEDGLVVRLASGETTVPWPFVRDLRHGWALTVHRALRSRWPAVVAVFPGDATGLLSRPLVYSAFTRAERHLSVVHAAGAALPRAVAHVGARPRRTRLASLLRSPGP